MGGAGDRRRTVKRKEPAITALSLGTMPRNVCSTQESTQINVSTMIQPPSLRHPAPFPGRVAALAGNNQRVPVGPERRRRVAASDRRSAAGHFAGGLSGGPPQSVPGDSHACGARCRASSVWRKLSCKLYLLRLCRSDSRFHGGRPEEGIPDDIFCAALHVRCAAPGAVDSITRTGDFITATRPEFETNVPFSAIRGGRGI